MSSAEISSGASGFTSTHISLPFSLEGVLAVRVKSLTSSARRFAQFAAAAGTEFAVDLIARAAGVGGRQAIEEMVNSGIIYESCAEPQPVYRFKHRLMQEAVLRTIVPSTLEGVYTDLLGSAEAESPGTVSPNQLARYAYRSAAPLRAIVYLERIADEALQAGLTQRAIFFLERAGKAADRAGAPDIQRRVNARAQDVLASAAAASRPDMTVRGS
jgi:hypothetical protein